jgi:hypothetical protein
MMHAASLWLAAALIFIAGDRPGTMPAKQRKDIAMAEDVISVLSNSKDSNQLYAAATSLITSPDAQDRVTLLKFLSREEFLNRLDSAKDYEAGAKFLHITRLVKAMRESASPGMQPLLVELMQQKEFISKDTRIELLIWASEEIRPAPPPVVAFWDDHCKPDDATGALVTVAMANNGSLPAIDLLEKKLSSPGFEDDERIWWMRTAVLTHRQDVPVLRACQRLLEKTLTEHLRPELVAVLFDYKPEQWHGPDGAYPPPPPAKATKEARQLTIKIGEYSLANIKLDEALKKLVEAKVEAFKREVKN